MPLIERLIVQHRIYMDLIFLESIYISNSIKDQDISRLENTLQNRERLINQLAELQGRIEGMAEKIHLDTLKEWYDDLSSWSEKIQSIDQQFIDSLTDEKNSLSEEISQLLKSKLLLKKYDLECER